MEKQVEERYAIIKWADHMVQRVSMGTLVFIRAGLKNKTFVLEILAENISREEADALLLIMGNPHKTWRKP